MFESQWLFALGGGMLIGSAALILLLFNAKVAGISGILAGALQQRDAWRWLFLLGLGGGSDQHAAPQCKQPLALKHRHSR